MSEAKCRLHRLDRTTACGIQSACLLAALVHGPPPPVSSQACWLLLYMSRHHPNPPKLARQAESPTHDKSGAASRLRQQPHQRCSRMPPRRGLAARTPAAGPSWPIRWQNRATPATTRARTHLISGVVEMDYLPSVGNTDNEQQHIIRRPRIA
eukprot:363547-Chlamydomonas_euryale.AAC.4